jgi:phosphoribosylaminoimidazolecarboxamide formyltransferase/IMP cyclohydrolase
MDRAIDSDPLSAFGGIVGLNRICDMKTADALFAKLNFIEVIVAPDFESAALLKLQEKKNLRILRIKQAKVGGRELQYKFTRLGVLVQEGEKPIALTAKEAAAKWKVVTKTGLSASDWEELLFAWKCSKLVKSNAIVLTHDQATVGIGAGQMSRVDSVRIACEKAGAKAKGSYLASDGFFPMPDNIELAALAGIRAIVQPGGSIKDEDVIKACDYHKIPMVFTGERHFRH